MQCVLNLTLPVVKWLLQKQGVISRRPTRAHSFHYRGYLTTRVVVCQDVLDSGVPRPHFVESGDMTRRGDGITGTFVIMHDVGWIPVDGNDEERLAGCEKGTGVVDTNSRRAAMDKLKANLNDRPVHKD